MLTIGQWREQVKANLAIRPDKIGCYIMKCLECPFSSVHTDSHRIPKKYRNGCKKFGGVIPDEHDASKLILEQLNMDDNIRIIKSL